MSEESARHIAWPTVLLAIAVVVGFVTSWALVLSGVPIWVGFLGNTVCAYLGFTPLHEACHGNVGGGKRWLDTTVGWACALLIYAPYPAFRWLHLRHHQHTNHPELDPDRWVASSGVLAVLVRCWTLAPHYYWSIFVDYRAERAVRKLHRGTVLTTLAVLGVIGAAVLGGWGVEVLWLWVLPGSVASAMLALLFDWLPHHPHGRLGRYENARVMLLPGLRWLMMGHNFHTVHHLYPSVPFYRYRAVFQQNRGAFEREGVEIWQPRYANRIWSR